jgi:hypothetical protein
VARGDLSKQGVRNALTGVAAKEGKADLPDRLNGVVVPASDVSQYARLLRS